MLAASAKVCYNCARKHDGELEGRLRPAKAYLHYARLGETRRVDSLNQDATTPPRESRVKLTPKPMVGGLLLQADLISKKQLDAAKARGGDVAGADHQRCQEVKEGGA